MHREIPRRIAGLAALSLSAGPALAHVGPEHRGQHLFEHLALAAVIGLLVWGGVRLFQRLG